MLLMLIFKCFVCKMSISTKFFARFVNLHQIFLPILSISTKFFARFVNLHQMFLLSFLKIYSTKGRVVEKGFMII